MIEERKKQYIIVSLIGVVALLLVWTIYGFVMTGRLTITAPENTANNAAVNVTILRDGQENQALTLQPGQSNTVKLRSGTVRLDASAGGIKAVDIVDVKRFYKTTTLTTPTGENRATEQLASATLPCPLTAGGATYSYACDSDGQIIEHRTNELGASLNTALFDGISFSLLQPLNGGLIGMYSSPNNPGELLSINLITKSITPMNLPGNVREMLEDDYPFITVPSDPNSSTFAMTFVSKNKTFVFDSPSDASPTEIKLPEGVRINAVGRTFSANFYKDQFTVYLGVSTEAGEGDDDGETSQAEAAAAAKLDSYLLEYSKEGKLTKTLTLPSDTTAQEVYKLSDDFYAANTPLNFTFYRLVEDTLVEVYSLADVGDWTFIDNTAYFQANGTIYEMVPGKNGAFGLHSVFSSANITVSQIFTDGINMLFTGFNAKSDSSDTNIYQLLNKPADPKDTNNNTSSTQNRVEPAYVAINGLLEYGVSADQVANLRFALSSYAAKQPKQITTIQLTDITPVDHDRFSESTVDAINFNLLVDGVVTPARLEYSDLITSRLIILNADGSQAYDSGPITNQQPL